MKNVMQAEQVVYDINPIKPGGGGGGGHKVPAAFSFYDNFFSVCGMTLKFGDIS